MIADLDAELREVSAEIEAAKVPPCTLAKWLKTQPDLDPDAVYAKLVSEPVQLMLAWAKGRGFTGSRNVIERHHNAFSSARCVSCPIPSIKS